MSRRTERLGSAIKQEVMHVIQRDLTDPRLAGTLPSVNRVKVSDDLAYADVYMVLMGTPGKQSAAMAALESATGLMRSKLGKALHVRTVPLLRIHLDEAYRREVEVLNLIAKANSEYADGEAPSDADPAEAPPSGADDQ